jgi:hypothetical protein
MFAVIFALPLLSLVLAVGVFVPWLGLRFELMHRAERRLAATLEAQTKVIRDQEATIEAYRQLVASDTSFTLTPPAPGPNRWVQMALATQASRSLLDSVAAQPRVLAYR